jgi:uncharacterized protein (TIGR04255 family)
VEGSDLNLVDFAKPPVQEVVFTVQFVDPVITFDILTQIRARIRDDYPQHQSLPMRGRLEERFDESLRMRFEIPWGAERPLHWFTSDDGQLLLQVQEDRLAFNWRRQGGDGTYPRYSQLRATFADHLSALISDLKAAGLNPAVDICELGYINELETPLRGEPPRAELRDALVPAKSAPSGDFLGPSDDLQWAARWLIPLDARPVGRLYADAQAAQRATDGKPVHVLTMTARLAQTANTLPEVFALFDLGHEWIVKGFADLTTKEMHETWERLK